MKLTIISFLIIAFCVINANAQKVSVDKSLLVGAQNEPANGVNINDNILWFNYLNGALRAGRLSSDAWSPNNSGTGSIAFGYNTIASGNYSMAINHESKAIGVSSFSSGFSSEARGNYSVALGLFTKAGARSSIALGQYNIGNGNPTSQILTDPIFEIGNGINSANRSNAMTILKNGNTGIGVVDPTENLEIEGAIKIGPNNNANSLNGTIRFQNNDIEARIGNNWKSLTSNFGNEVDSLTVSEYLYIGEPNTGFYIENSGAVIDHGKSLVFSKPNSSLTGFAWWDHPRQLRNQNDFCFLETGANPYFRINLGNSNYYFREEGLSYATDNENINIGFEAGLSDTVTIGSIDNIQIGHFAGKKNRTGDDNIFIGSYAGFQTIGGSNNTYIGNAAGLINTGTGNVFIGNNAGSSTIGNNQLYIDNSNTTLPLIFGNFDTDDIQINGALKIDEQDFGFPLVVEAQDELKFRVSTTGTLFVRNRLGFETFVPLHRLQIPNNSDIGEGRAIAFAWETYSDQRVKENVKELTYGLDEILKLNPVKYHHLNSTFEKNKLELSKTYYNDIGFIAQEVHEIIQEVVNKPENEKTTLWSMNYEKLTPVLVKAIQQQQKIIEELKTAEAQMKIKQDEMQAELKAIKDLLGMEVSRN